MLWFKRKQKVSHSDPDECAELTNFSEADESVDVYEQNSKAGYSKDKFNCFLFGLRTTLYEIMYFDEFMFL